MVAQTTRTSTFLSSLGRRCCGKMPVRGATCSNFRLAQRKGFEWSSGIFRSRKRGFLYFFFGARCGPFQLARAPLVAKIAAGEKLRLFIAEKKIHSRAGYTGKKRNGGTVHFPRYGPRCARANSGENPCAPWIIPWPVATLALDESGTWARRSFSRPFADSL